MRTATAGKPWSISATLPVNSTPETARVDDSDLDRPLWRRIVVALVALRAAVSLVAIPLAPFLYREHAAVLVLLRPTKEVLLFAGFLVGDGKTTLPVVVVAALPMLLAGVWCFFALGRSYAGSLRSGDVPSVVRRLLPPERVARLDAALARRGAWLVLLLRLAAFPSSLVAATAGSAGMPVRRFLVADMAGALLSLALLVGTGMAAEDSHHRFGLWFTIGGGLVLVAAAVLGRRLVRDAADGSPDEVRAR